MAVAAIHSLPGAPVVLWLNFAGAPSFSWYGQQTAPTPAYAGTEAQRQQVWGIVAEKFSPWRIDVTDQQPAAGTPSVEILIGGTGGWLGLPYGGVSEIGSYNFGQYPAASFVFSDVFSSYPLFVADAAAHEAGHDFDLYHQSTWTGETLMQEYNTGTAYSAPLMGNADNATYGRWWDGTPDYSPTVDQDDLAILDRSLSRRPYSHGQDVAHADPVTLTGNTISASGVIVDGNEHDVLSFDTGAGTVTLTCMVPFGGMLHPVLFLEDAGGDVLASSDGPGLDQYLTADLAAGEYYITVRSDGVYGSIGEYDLTGTIVPEPAALALALPFVLGRRRRRK